MRATEHLGNARTELLEGDGDERLRLLYAARSFRDALNDYRDWPTAVQVQADSLRMRLGVERPLVGRGPIAEAVAAMSDERLREVSDELWRFCEFSISANRD